MRDLGVLDKARHLVDDLLWQISSPIHHLACRLSDVGRLLPVLAEFEWALSSDRQQQYIVSCIASPTRVEGDIKDLVPSHEAIRKRTYDRISTVLSKPTLRPSSIVVRDIGWFILFSHSPAWTKSQSEEGSLKVVRCDFYTNKTWTSVQVFTRRQGEGCSRMPFCLDYL